MRIFRRVTAVVRAHWHPIVTLQRFWRWWTRVVLYGDLQEWERCPVHPSYPEVGPHAMLPIMRIGIVSGVPGCIGGSCQRCGAMFISSTFYWKQIQWLGQRGLQDHATDWIMGRWTPMVVPEGTEIDTGFLQTGEAIRRKRSV
jgi:hypothetical protein